jgi:hypothetical protein
MQRILQVMMAAAEIKTTKGAQLFRKFDAKPLHRVSTIVEVKYPAAQDLRIGLDLTPKAMLYSIETEHESFEGFNFLPGLYGTRPHGEMRFSVLMDDKNEILRDLSLDLDELQDNQWSQVLFIPIMPSKGRTFQVRVSVKAKHGRVALYEISTRKTDQWTRLKWRVENLIHRHLPYPLNEHLPPCLQFIVICRSPDPAIPLIRTLSN